MLLEKRDSNELYESIFNDTYNGFTKPYWDKLGLNKDAINTLYILYLLQRLSIAASEEAGSYQEINQFSRIINLLVNT